MSKRNEPNHGLDFIHLVKISKKIKKPFHGRFFASYLRKFRPFNKKGILSCFTRFAYKAFNWVIFIKAEEFDKDSSIRYAQILLEANYLETVQEKSKLGSFFFQIN